MKKTDEVAVSGTEEVESKKTVYEVGYMMIPTIAEENLSEEVSNLKESLSGFGVTFISDENPKMMELAYEMSRSIENKKQHFSYGYFGWVKFEVEPNKVKSITTFLDKNEKLIRYLLITTVRENTISSKRPYTKIDGAKRRPQVKSEQALPIDEEVIDKEIEALIVE